MRLSEAKVQSLSEQLLQTLIDHPQVTLKANPSQVLFKIKTVIFEDLRREEALDQEVHEILQAHMRQMRRVGADYNTLFKKVKAQLIRERKLVI